MAEKRPAETSTEEPVSKKRQMTNISNDSDNTKTNKASGTSDASSETTNASSVIREPQIKQESRPKHFYFQKNKKYLCIHCTNVIITLNVNSHTFQCMTCNKITHFNDYYQKNNVIHEKLIQNMEFSWSQLRESNQLNIEKNKKNQENFNKMKEYLSSIEKLRDEIREYEKVNHANENRNYLGVSMFIDKKIKGFENEIKSIKKKIETLTIS